MRKLSGSFPPVEQGSAVWVRVPEVNKSQGEARNIFAVTVEIPSSVFHLFVCSILKQLYFRLLFSSFRRDVYLDDI
jgi:hypothetical protein